MESADYVSLAVAVLAIVVSLVVAFIQHRLNRRTYDQTEQHYLEQLWQSVLDLTVTKSELGLPRVRLTSLMPGGAGLEGCSDAQEVPAGVQA